MSAIKGAIDAIATQESEYKPKTEFDGSTGFIQTAGIKSAPKSFNDILSEFGYDPSEVQIAGSPRISKWQRYDGEWLTAYKFVIEAVNPDALDLPSLYAAARRKPRAKLSGERKKRTTVVCLSDIQAGKTSHRGGTPELLDRLREKRNALEAHLKKVRPESLVLAEGGDLFENFESGGNPMFTNDLSLAQQMDVAGAEVFEFSSLMARFGHVDVLAVTSNHTAWRRGKQELGDPHDDLALHVHRQVEKLANATGLDVKWHYPDMYSESVALDVRGTVLGMVHGNQFSGGAAGAIKWWSGQQHGGQAVGMADILLTGHYHHLAMQPSGRNPRTGKSKWWIQMPTLDNGSTWYRNKAGDDSDPGLLVFDITEDGFDLQSLVIL